MPTDLRLAVLQEDEPLFDNQPVFRSCVFHDDNNRDNLAIYADHVWCYACLTYMRADAFAAKYLAHGEAELAFTKTLGQSVKYAHKSAVRSQVHLESLAASSAALLWKTPHALEYLRNRGIDDATAARYHLGHTGFAYILPIRDPQGGAVLSLRFRRDDERDPHGKHKYWGERGYNDLQLYPFPPHADPHADPRADPQIALLTEGEFDALLLRAHGLPAYSFTNGSMGAARPDAVRALLTGLRHVVLVGDQDPPGRKTMAQIAGMLGASAFTTNITWQPTVGKDITALWQYSRACSAPTPFAQVVAHLRRLIETRGTPDGIPSETPSLTLV